jgi:hypothetical protein
VSGCEANRAILQVRQARLWRFLPFPAAGSVAPGAAGPCWPSRLWRPRSAARFRRGGALGDSSLIGTFSLRPPRLRPLLLRFASWIASATSLRICARFAEPRRNSGVLARSGTLSVPVQRVDFRMGAAPSSLFLPLSLNQLPVFHNKTSCYRYAQEFLGCLSATGQPSAILRRLICLLA